MAIDVERTLNRREIRELLNLYSGIYARNENERNECAQAVRVRLSMRARTVPDAAPLGYFARLFKSAIIDQIRAEAPERMRAVNLDDAHEMAYTSKAIDNLHARIDAQTAIDRLRPFYKIAIQAYITAECDLDEAAALLGVTKPAFKSRLYRAQYLLRGGRG